MVTEDIPVVMIKPMAPEQAMISDDSTAEGNTESGGAYSDKSAAEVEASRKPAQVDVQVPATGQGDPQKPARTNRSSNSNHRAGNHRKGSEIHSGHTRSSEEEVALSSWSWPAESAFADSASSRDTSSVSAGSGEAVVVRQLAFNGWSSDVVRVARAGPPAWRRKAPITKPLLVASLLCGAVLLYRGTRSDKVLRCNEPTASLCYTHIVIQSPPSALMKGRRGLKAGAEAAEGEAVEGGEENRREGTGEESSEGESVKEDGRGIGEGEGGSAVGEGGVTKGMGAGGWRGVVVGRGREERMRVVVAPHVNPEHARMLEGLKELQVIDADVAPAGICTRREFATWLMAFSEKLSASPTDRVYPAMFIEGISEQAYADVAPDDQDFAAIQGLAEAGILPSLLGRKDEAGGAAAGEGAGEGEALFRPDSPLTRQDLLTWRFALEYSHLPPPDLAALRHTCGLIDAARISPAAQRAVSFDLLHHRGGMEHQPEGEEEGWGQAGGKGLGEGQGRGQDFKSATNAAVIPLVFGNVRRFDPLKPVTHAQAAAALTFGRTYETVNEAAVRVEVAEARKEADVARQEAESAKREAAQLAEEMERAAGGGASVEGSASYGTEEGSIQEPAILPPGWWAELIQQRAEEAKHGAAKNLVKIKERSADVASSLAASVADGSLQRSLSKRAEEAARKVRGLQGADLKEGARMVREQVGGEVGRRIEGVREVGERMVSMGREEASRMVRVGKGVMDSGVREIREKAGYRWAAGRAAGKAGSRGSVGSATAAAGAAGAAGGGVKKQ
ncbi:unnamed protein product [Closterium sp. NIES-64]|nr:unnamed protein product [Closterium sp. NIES-64]